MKRLIWLAILCPALTFAQVQKCTIDGKTVYSDSLCGQRGEAVNTDANNLDTSGLRDLAAKQEAQARQEQAKATARPRGGKPGPCDHLKPANPVPTSRETEQRRACLREATRSRASRQ